MEALRKTRLAPIRCSESMAKPRYPTDVMAASSSAQRNGFRPEFLTDRKQAFGNLIKGFVPRKPRPLARTARTDAAPWILQTIRMIDDIDSDRSDWAEPAVVKRRFPIALNLHQYPISHMQQNAAAAVATAANALEHSGPKIIGLRNRSVNVHLWNTPCKIKIDLGKIVYISTGRSIDANYRNCDRFWKSIIDAWIEHSKRAGRSDEFSAPSHRSGPRAQPTGIDYPRDTGESRSSAQFSLAL